MLSSDFCLKTPTKSSNSKNAVRKSPRLIREQHVRNSPGVVTKTVEEENTSPESPKRKIPRNETQLRKSPRIQRKYAEEKSPLRKSPRIIKKSLESENSPETPSRKSPRVSRTTDHPQQLRRSPRKRTPSKRATAKRRVSLEELGLTGKRRNSLVHEGECTKCSLCRKEEQEMYHIKNWTAVFHMWNDANSRYQMNDCYCSHCIGIIRKQFRERKSQQRIEKTKEVKRCVICDQENTIQFEVKDHNQFTECFSRKSPAEQVFLCKRHYQKIKNFANRKLCPVCQMVLRVGIPRKKCPVDTDIATTFISSSMGKFVTLSPDDLMCKACHDKILKGTPNEILLRNIQNLKQSTVEHDPKYALYCTASKMATIFQNKRACLLIDMLDVYHASLPDDSMARSTSVWLLSELMNIFGDGLKSARMHASQCSKLLFFNEISCEALHEALYNIRQLQTQSRELKEEISILRKRISSSNDSKEITPRTIVDVLTHVNKHLKSASKHIEAVYVNDPSQITELNMDMILRHIPCNVFNFIKMLTMNGPEKECLPDTIHVDLDTPIEFEAGAVASRKAKRVFITSTVMNIINSRCTYPLPIVVAETVKKISGSQQLVSILNKMGFCSSEDSRLAFEQYSKERKQSTPIGKQLDENLLTVITLDNLDALSPWAMVTSGVDRSGWHGTTICALQPRFSDNLCEGDRAISMENNGLNTLIDDEEDDPDTYSKVQVYGDGRCLFRSIA
ncbi:unnamed protein product, partial [Owenia fusiformis]